MRTVLPAVADAGAHALLRPLASVARNWTSVWPGAVMAALLPAAAADQVLPPSVDVRYA